MLADGIELGLELADLSGEVVAVAILHFGYPFLSVIINGIKMLPHLDRILVIASKTMHKFYNPEKTNLAFSILFLSNSSWIFGASVNLLCMRARLSLISSKCKA